MAQLRLLDNRFHSHAQQQIDTRRHTGLQFHQSTCRQPANQTDSFTAPYVCFRFLANGTVRSVSTPVMREEGPPTISAEQKAAAAHTHRHTQVSTGDCDVIRDLDKVVSDWTACPPPLHLSPEEEEEEGTASPSTGDQRETSDCSPAPRYT